MTSKNHKSIAQFLFVLALFCVTSALVFGQAGGGQGAISGVVVDASGSAVPDAAVTITNEAKGVHREIKTNGEGIFSAPALVPADGYKVTVKKSGFADYEATDISLAVGQSVPLRVNLAVGATATQVDVSAEPALVDDVKTDVSQVINQGLILDLPTNGRRVDNFVLGTPGVAPDGAFGLLSFRGIAGHNNFLTDGNDTTNSFFNENAGRTRISSPISQEAVQEFQVISNNFAAEYGNAMGGVINTITKSGSNGVHGTAYWFFRNRSLNARDRYAAFNPQDVRHQAGASVGGPIKKDKIFYFFNYEATRRDFPAIASITSANGNLFTATGALNTANSGNVCGAPATPAQCTAAINMLTTRNFGTISRTVTQDLGFGKIDIHLSDRNTLSLSTSALRWVSPHGIQATGIVFNRGDLIGNNADSTVRNVYSRAALTTIVASNMVNELRFGFFKDRLYDPASPDFLFPGLGLASLTINSTNNLGLANSYPRLNPSENRYEIADNFSWVKASHTLKFGFDLNINKDYVNQLINQFGSYSYATTIAGGLLPAASALTNFALDFSGNTTGGKHWTTYSQAFGNPIVDLTTKSIGLYAQDQYRVNNRLVVNYGLRYDYTAIPQPTLSNPDYPQTGVIPTTKDNFAPRVGLSFTLDQSRKTLLRVGYGMFYARYQTGLIENLMLSNGVYQKSITYNVATTGQLAAGPVYPNNLPSTSLNPLPNSVDILFADKNLRNPYTHQANLGIERAINSTTSVNVAYNFSRGVRLYGVRDLNVPAAGNPITYTILDPAGAVAGTYTTNTYRLINGNRPDSRYRRVSQLENPGLSYYNGLTVQVTRRMSKGFQGQVAYTWSHAIDLNQSGASNNIFFSATPTSYANDFAAERGSAVNDTRHRLVVMTVWSPTFTQSKSMFARYLINNWQLSQVTTLQSPQPVNSTVNIAGNAFTGNLVSGSLNGLGGAFSRVPFQPISNLRLDSIYRVDARLAKKLPFTERVTGYLQFEAFNVFNTPYDTQRNAQEYNLNGTTLTYLSGYGTPTSTAASPDGTTARRAQVSLRVTF